jgi:plasmid stabilization system protein ParE
LSRFIFHPRAEHELEEAVRWYGQQRQGLGREFRIEIEGTLTRVSEHPLAYATILGRWRRAPVRRFPYVIIYRAVGDTIYVLSCFHTRRNPKHWKKRL